MIIFPKNKETKELIKIYNKDLKWLEKVWSIAKKRKGFKTNLKEDLNKEKKEISKAIILANSLDEFKGIRYDAEDINYLVKDFEKYSEKKQLDLIRNIVKKSREIEKECKKLEKNADQKSYPNLNKELKSIIRLAKEVEEIAKKVYISQEYRELKEKAESLEYVSKILEEKAKERIKEKVKEEKDKMWLLAERLINEIKTYVNSTNNKEEAEKVWNLAKMISKKFEVQL